MSADPSFLFNQSFNAMNSYLQSRPTSEKIGNIFLIVWWISGLIEDEYLFILSVVVTSIMYIVGLIESIAKKLPIGSYTGGAFRRFIIGLWANAMYIGGKTPGPETIELDNFSIEVTFISGMVITAFALLWFVTKYFDRIDLNSPFEMNTFYLLIRGLLRGSILFGLLYSLFTPDPTKIEDPYVMVLFIAYLLDPLVAFIQSHYEETLDPVQLSLGFSKLPMTALRDVMISNTFFLIFTISFNGLGDPAPESWKLLRSLYVLLAVVFLVMAMDTIKKHNKNPLGRSVLGTILDKTAQTISNIKIDDRIGYVMDKPHSFKLNKNNSLNVARDSIIIPIGEEKGKIKAIVIGRGENLIKSKKELVSQVLEGVSTVIIPAKQFKQIRKNIIPTRMDQINLDHLQLPSLDTIQMVVDKLAFQLTGWMNELKKGLSSMKLSNYGVSEVDGITNVKLPGIKVIEGKGMTKVDVFGIHVLETPSMTNVRIGDWLTVIEVPKFTFVSMPGITVLDMTSGGTAIDIFGFKVGDGIDATRLDEFKRIILEQMGKFQTQRDQDIGRILVEKNSAALMSMSWDGEFRPMLQGKKDTYGSHPALGTGETSSEKLLTGDISKSPAVITPQFAELTGYGTEKKKKPKKRRSLVSMDLDIAGAKIQVGRAKEEMNKVLEDVQNELEDIKSEINSDKKPTKHSDEEFIDVDYEIVEDED